MSSKKVGLITFHGSYNCGSLLQAYALQSVLTNYNLRPEIINFQSLGQIRLYHSLFPLTSPKNFLKNCLLLPNLRRLEKNRQAYSNFIHHYFFLTRPIISPADFSALDYPLYLAGSDQIWNITIDDYSDAYFLDWVKNARRVAYAPSFGAKNPAKYSLHPERYQKFLNSFNFLSVRERNGQRWIRELTGKTVPLLPDPTLLLSPEDYNSLLPPKTPDFLPKDYIFFYCPSFNPQICRFVRRLAASLRIPVITWSAKSYFTKRVWRFGFKLPPYEDPSLYLLLIKNAKLVLTTSFHGTIFSALFKKPFFTLKNGEMYGDDDRVITLLAELGLTDRLIPYNFDPATDYLALPDYRSFDKNLRRLRRLAHDFLKESLKI